MKPASPVLGVKFSSSFIKRYKKSPEYSQHIEHLCDKKILFFAQNISWYSSYLTISQSNVCQGVSLGNV